ncbi:glycoside hydrolase [Dyella acidiphila]|uniref:Glycoside hydrolase n=1 Tax=Dyella acidiphila TaxID=2775866 RepID=A0ABR9G774_9GAMM|nr:glycoside hydrolase [Dyella acidiphila]MBE1159895.1 glycoside hydrolase [Dyella acidiphila]
MVTAFMFGSRVAWAETAPVANVTLGHSTVALNGPWRFHVGDDPRWSSPDFDDSSWETVDLTPAPGAHDGDVGLPGYVSGWSKRGHAQYTGYAWYRLKITVAGDHAVPLALAGPTLVDSTYQVYVNGKLQGGSGVFSGAVPKVLGVRPSVFPLASWSPAGTNTYLIAFRVWMDPLDAGDDNGGIHVAPAIGDAQSIDALHQLQWLQTFKGYVADAIEPCAFVVLALMVFALIACRTPDTYRWLAMALLLLALLRVNQVLFYWTPWLSLRSYDLATVVILKPLNLAAWTLAWRDWFRVNRYPWLGHVVGGLAVAYAVGALMGRPWFMPEASHALKLGADLLVEAARLGYAALYVGIIGLGVIRAARLSDYLAALCAILVGVGLFATELNALGIPGIWFPYGTGVARGQYAYAVFIPLLFWLILLRAAGYARKT